MKLLSRASAAGAVGIAALMASTPIAAAPVSIRTFGAEQVRLATIAYRISAANADSCRPSAMTGIIAHDISQYDRSLRPAISRAFSLTTGIGVLGVVPRSAAEQAGLQIDDEIVGVGGISVEDPAAFQLPAKSYKRNEAFGALLARTPQSGPVEIRVRRKGQLRTLTLTPRWGCGGDVTLANSSKLNAWSDGTHVVITTAMAKLARSDDEVAFVVAHEMAHNILGHAHADGQRRGIFGGLAQARRDEIDADSFAVRLMSRGGYQPRGGIAFLHTVGSKLWWAFSLDHPTFNRRIRAVSNAIATFPVPTTPAEVAESQPAGAQMLAKSLDIADASEKSSVTLASFSPRPTFSRFAFSGVRRSCEY